MPSSVWQIADRVATLKDSALGGSLTPNEPAAGLWIDQVFGDPVPRAALFQVATAASATAEYFDRGTDLVATYEEAGLRDLRIQVYWRIVDRSLVEPTTAAVDLILSVQTSRPEIYPTFSVSSLLRSSENQRLLASETAQFTACGESTDGIAFSASEGPGCFLFRGASRFSYAEMVHPADFQKSRLTYFGKRTGQSQLMHWFFDRPLEKGVILRSRLRGLFVPRDRDMELTAAEYRRFAASEPPLTA
jgi:hypothetical protein